MKMMNTRAPAPGTGKAVTHSKSSGILGSAPAPRMPGMTPPKMAVPKDHTCKVCPGSARR